MICSFMQAHKCLRKSTWEGKDKICSSIIPNDNDTEILM
jgi:hypothetical protein